MSPANFDSRIAELRPPPHPPRKSRPRAPRQWLSGWTFRPELQTLEDRTVLDGTVKMSQGLLTIIGTVGADSALIQQIVGPGNQDQVAVTLNGQTSTFKAAQVNRITATLLAGDDTITLDESVKRVTPPLSFDSDGGTDSLIYKGTTGADAITVTGSTIALPGAGLLTYSNFESLDINCLGGTDTVTVTMGTLAGQLTVRAGTVTNSNIGTVAATGLLDVSEVPMVADAGLLRDSAFGTVLGRVHAGSIVNTTFTTIAPGASVLAAGQGTTSDVSIGTLSGSFTAPEDSNPGSGTMSGTSIDSITSTGYVSTGHISGMTVGTADVGSSITAAGQGTTSDVSIGTLSGSFTAPEDANPGSGTMSGTTIGSITSTGTVSTGAISGMTVGTADAGSSITAAGQGTTTDVSIGTLSGSFTAPEDANPGSGIMSGTTITSITSTGYVSTGAISGMTVGTADAGSSITAAGHGTITGITINLLSGTVTAELDANPGSGTITNATLGTITATGRIVAGAAVTDLAITTIEGGGFEAGSFGIVTAVNVTADEVRLVEADATRTLKVSAVAGFARPQSYSLSYNGTAPGNPVASVQVAPGAAGNIRYDFSLLTDTVGVAGTGIDLVSFTSVGKAYLRNLVVAGSLKPAPGTPAVNLPLDSAAVAAAGNIPSGGIRLQSTPAVAFGSANGIGAAAVTLTDVAGLFAAGTATVQANDTFQVFAGEGTPVAQFLVTGANGGNFDGKRVLYTDQGVAVGAGQYRPVTAAVTVAAAGGAATIQKIDLTGEAASFQTQQLVSQSITVLSGSLGDLTLSAPGGSPADITAPRIVGNIDVTNGGISGTVRTTEGDFGRAIRDAAGTITGVTFVRAGAGGLTATGRIISAANLVSLLDLQSSLDGVVAVQGDIGVIQTDASGNAVVGSGPGSPLTRFGGINVSTGGVKGSIVALGNAFGDINVSGGLDGRIAIKGRTVAGLSPTRTGILGNISIGGGMNTTAAIVSAGRIGDDGITDATRVGNDGVGTKLSISGAVKGIIAAADDINYGTVGNTSAASVFEYIGPDSPNGQVIASIFTDGGVTLTIPDGLSLILADLGFLRVGPDGNLTVTPP